MDNVIILNLFLMLVYDYVLMKAFCERMLAFSLSHSSANISSNFDIMIKYESQFNLGFCSFINQLLNKGNV